MHRPSLRRLLGLGIIAASLAPGAARAQTPVPAKSTLGKPDLALLARSVAAIKREKALKTLSVMQITASGQGLTMTFHEQLAVISQKPGEYHSEVTLQQPGGAPGARYTVVSDGVKVWVYQPGARSYAVLPRAVFQQDDISGLGLFASLIADTTGESNGRLDLSGLARSGLKLQVNTETAGGMDYRVFGVTDPKQGYRFRLFVDPETATVHQILLSGQEKQIAFTVTETITAQSPLPVQPAALFHFTPPPAVKRVKQISIGPF